MVSDGGRPKLLDLFCGAGGAGEGYRRAGFDVDGVDIEAHTYPPGRFFQRDAMEFRSYAYLDGFDVIHLGDAREAMGIDWMGMDDLREAIPPAFTQFIGRQLLPHTNHTNGSQA